jgi:hypothetical protein|nr:hypothetical protein [Kofleriaceae bacterium]
MGVHGRRLLAALATRGVVKADELGLSEAELAAAVAELGTLVDDDNQRVHAIKTYQANGRITALELTATGRGLATHAR